MNTHSKDSNKIVIQNSQLYQEVKTPVLMPHSKYPGTSLLSDSARSEAVLVWYLGIVTKRRTMRERLSGRLKCSVCHNIPNPLSSPELLYRLIIFRQEKLLAKIQVSY